MLRQRRTLPSAFTIALGLAAVAGALPAHAATFTVNSTADAVDGNLTDGVCDTGITAPTGVCTLRAAIQQANVSDEADTIILPSGTYMLTIQGPDENIAEKGDLDILSDLTITGAGPDATIVDTSLLSERAFEIYWYPGPTVTISGITVQGNGVGDGIANAGRLTLENVTVRNNARGGINNAGTLSIINSTISGNWTPGEGGGIANAFGTATVINSTISGNAANRGAGISNGWMGTVTVRNSTISGNTANQGTVSNQRGGGILNEYAPFGFTTEVTNTLIAGNSAPTGPDCFGTLTSTGGHNLVQVVSGDCTVTGGGAGDLINIDPMLGPLSDNGGPTPTHALQPGSPAIDGGENTGCPAADQRGVPRVGAACEIGAFEFVAPAATFTTSAGQLANLSAVPDSILPTAGKPAATFPFGFFAWTVTGLPVSPPPAPPASITMTMTYPAAIATGAEYWKVIGGTWVDVTSLLGSDDGDEVLTLTITDGGLGDEDGMVNGVIVDPGGVGSGGSVDTTPPTIECDLPDGLWHAADVALACTAIDDGSGLADAGDAAFSLVTNVASNTETANAGTNSREVCDAAGNCAIAGPIGGNKVDKKAPIVTCEPTPAVLWPPNHQMVDVTVAVAINDEGAGAGAFELTSAASSESDNGIGGFTPGTPATAGQLRAERSGAGTGRTYRLTYTGLDQAGNGSTCEAIVRVPHDRREK